MKTWVLVLILLMSFKTQAKTYEEIYKDYSENAYKITLELCTFPAEADGIIDSLIYYSRPAGFAVDGLQSSVDIGDGAMKISPELAGLIESEGYQQALRECFGSSFEVRQSFTNRLFVMDTAGRAIGFFSMARVMSLATHWMSKTAWAVRNPKKFATLIHIPDFLALSGLAFMVKEHYSKFEFQNRIQQNPCMLVSGANPGKLREDAAVLKRRADRFLTKTIELKNQTQLTDEENDFLVQIEDGLKIINETLIALEQENETNNCVNLGSRAASQISNLKSYRNLKAMFLNLQMEKQGLLEFIRMTQPKAKNFYKDMLVGIEKNMNHLLQRLERNPHSKKDELAYLRSLI